MIRDHAYYEARVAARHLLLTEQIARASAALSAEKAARTGAKAALVEQALPPPPGVSETVIALFCARKTRNAVLGDMADDFIRNVNRFGIRRAKRIYRVEAWRCAAGASWQAARSLVRLETIAKLISGQ